MKISGGIILTILTLSGYAQAGDVKFNPRMLGLDEEQVSVTDLDYFSAKDGVAPGEYVVDIYINHDYYNTRKLRFIPEGKSIRPEFSVTMLQEMGISLPSDVKQETDVHLPKGLEHYIPAAQTKFNAKKSRLDISIPQTSINSGARGQISPELWDNGINALLLNYRYSGSQSTDTNDNSKSSNNFLGIHSGFNFDAWRLRYDGTLTQNSGDDDEGTHWDSIDTYLQRSFTFLQGSQLTMGRYATSGDLFSSIQFTGAQLSSDDDMLPDSMQNFAPRITGVASSTSRITVRQNGNVVYQTTVSAGPYAIKDLYSIGAGDLQVTVEDSNGSKTRYTVPFNTLPLLQRQGRYKYALTAGEYHSSNSNTDDPTFVQGTLLAGLPLDTTLYGGLQYSNNYTSYLLGAGRNFGVIGAVSVDSAYSRAQFNGRTETGYKTREQLTKSFDTTDTSLQTTLTQYSRNYNAFSDRQDYYSDDGSDMDIYNRDHNKRHDYSVSVSQTSADWGSLSLSGYIRDYYDTEGKEKNWQVSYGNDFAGVSYTLAYSNTNNPGAKEHDKRVSMNLSVPLDRFLNQNHMWLNYSMNTTKHGSTIQQAGISGTTLEDNSLNYAVSQGYTTGNESEGASGNASLNYKGQYAEASLGYSYDPDSRQVNYSLQGGALLHSHGLTLSQPMNGTVALVAAPGATNVTVGNNTGVKTDWRGYTVVPYLQSFRRNRVYLDPKTLGDDVDIERSTDFVIPTKGAVVLAKFSTHVGRRMLVTLHDKANKPLPFGTIAAAKTEDATSTGIVDETGTVYMTGMPDKGHITLKWGAKNACSADYKLKVASDSDVSQLTLICE